MRQYMIDFRNERGLSLKSMSRVCKVSHGLLAAIEELDFVTHPAIAARIAAAYKLTLDQYNSLVPENHRTNKIPKPVDPPSGTVNLSKKFC